MTDSKALAKAAVDALPDTASLQQIAQAVSALQQSTTESRTWRKKLVVIRALVSAAALGFAWWSAHVALGARPTNGIPPQLSWSLGIVFLFWTVGPAVWFWIEYYFLWPKTGTPIEELKYGQELSKSVWVAIAAVLITLYARG